VLATVPDSKLVTSIIPGMARNGVLVIMGASPEPIQVNPILLLSRRLRLQGWASGHAKDAEETINFSLQAGIKAVVEKFPLAKAAEAYNHMLTGNPQFRVVITMDE